MKVTDEMKFWAYEGKDTEKKSFMIHTVVVSNMYLVLFSRIKRNKISLKVRLINLGTLESQNE